MEQEYLELMEELKTKYEKISEEKEHMRRKKIEIITVLTTLYGLIRMLKEIILNIDDLPCICRHLVEYIYSELDNILFDNENFDLLSIHSLDIIQL